MENRSREFGGDELSSEESELLSETEQEQPPEFVSSERRGPLTDEERATWEEIRELDQERRAMTLLEEAGDIREARKEISGLFKEKEEKEKEEEIVETTASIKKAGSGLDWLFEAQIKSEDRGPADIEKGKEHVLIHEDMPLALISTKRLQEMTENYPWAERKDPKAAIESELEKRRNENRVAKPFFDTYRFIGRISIHAWDYLRDMTTFVERSPEDVIVQAKRLQNNFFPPHIQEIAKKAEMEAREKIEKEKK